MKTKTKRAKKNAAGNPFALCAAYVQQFNNAFPALQDPSAASRQEKDAVIKMIKWLLTEMKQDCDVAAIAYLLSLGVGGHDASCLNEFGLNPLELHAVGQRYRKHKVWHVDDAVELFGDEVHFDLIVNIGRGIFTRYTDKNTGDLNFTFASLEAAENWRVRGGHPPFADEALENIKKQLAASH